jgi:hypothetical protein
MASNTVFLDLPLSSDVIAALKLEERSGESRHLPKSFLSLDGKRVLFRTRRWYDLPSGVDTRPWAETGKVADVAGSKSSAKLFLPLPPEDLESVQELEERLKQACLSQRPLQPGGLSWVPLVKKTERSAQAGLTLKVLFNGKSYIGNKPTQLKVLTPDREVCSGLGWAFLEPHMHVSDDFKQGSCLATFEVSFWEMDHKLGASLHASALWLRPSKHIIHEDCTCLARAFDF